MEAQFDVAAVSIETSTVLWVSGPHNAENADAVTKMAIMRQGVEDRFFSPCQHGQYKAGEKWTGGVPLPVLEEDPDYIHAGGMYFPRGKRGL
jgi:hypothetical protein